MENGMDKRQIKKRFKEILEELEQLKSDVEEARDSIEPYDYKDDLTEAQQERYDWLDNVYNDLDNAIDSLEYSDANE